MNKANCNDCEYLLINDKNEHICLEEGEKLVYCGDRNCYFKQLQQYKQLAAQKTVNIFELEKEKEQLEEENEELENKLARVQIACVVDSYEFSEGDNLIQTSIILEIIKGKQNEWN